MELRECEEKGFIRNVSPNLGLIESLKEMAQIKHEEVLQQHLTQRNISVYFVLYYDAIRELLEAYGRKEGFKILNHVCLAEKIQELNNEFDYTTFDRIRYLRNGVNYYGKHIDFNQGKKLMKRMEELYYWVLKQLDR